MKFLKRRPDFGRCHSKESVCGPFFEFLSAFGEVIYSRCGVYDRVYSECAVRITL